MIFEIVSYICTGIVALELIGIVIFFIALFMASADDETINNESGKIICLYTMQPCIKTRIAPTACNDCPMNPDRDEEAGHD